MFLTNTNTILLIKGVYIYIYEHLTRHHPHDPNTHFIVMQVSPYIPT